METISRGWRLKELLVSTIVVICMLTVTVKLLGDLAKSSNEMVELWRDVKLLPRMKR